MRAALLLVIAAGVAIGCLVPTKRIVAVAPPAPPLAEPPVTAPMPAAIPSTTLSRAENGHFYANALIGGTSIRFMVDTGATGIALTMEDAKRLGLPVDPAKFEVVGSGASGAVRGQMLPLRTVEVEGKRVEGLSAMVAEGLGVSLLGQSYLRHLRSVEIRGDTMTLR